MSERNPLVRAWHDLLAAVQFLTRVPVPESPEALSLPRALKFFPLVGMLIGAAAGLLHGILAAHLPTPASAFFTVVFLLVVTGCMHEDGLADAADGFGGGWTRERVLSIMRDSRTGSYGAAAIALSVVGRIALIAALPAASVPAYLIVAQVLCRWTTLPLSYFVAPARTNGEESAGLDAGLGARLARLSNRTTLAFGTLFTLIVVIYLLGARGLVAMLAAALVTLLSGAYYRRRIGGVTGDCFGATNQIAEIAVYVCGAWAL